MQAVADGFVDQGVVDQRDRAGPIIATAQLCGEHGSKKIFRAHPLEVDRDFLSSGGARESEGASRVPAPAIREQRRL